MITFAILAALMAEPSTGPAAAAAPPQSIASEPVADVDREELATLNRQWLEAYRSHDGATLERILADDFQAVYPGDRLTNKTDLIAGATRPGRTIDQLAWTNLRILVFGDAAVVTGRVSMSGTTVEGPFSVINDYADVYARRDGRWQAISAHVVRAAQ